MRYNALIIHRTIQQEREQIQITISIVDAVNAMVIMFVTAILAAFAQEITTAMFASSPIQTENLKTISF